MSRRWAMVCAAVASLLLTACPPRSEPTGSLSNPPRRPGVRVIGVVTPDSPRVAPFVATLRSELANDFDVMAIPVSRSGKPEDLAARIEQLAPVAVVLVDNRAASLYRQVAAERSNPPPAVLVMTSFVQHVQPTVPNSTAITFEPPAVVTLTHLRTLLGREIRRAGVVYRAGFEEFIAREQQLATSEAIQLVTVRVPRHPSVTALGRALHELEDKELDAVWISNDNVLLSHAMLRQAWVPFARKTDLPIVVGVPSLIQGGVPFGIYAAVPDLQGLGLQAADLVYDLDDAGWKANRVPVQPAYSMKTYLNVSLARELGAQPDAEQRVDVLVGF